MAHLKHMKHDEAEQIYLQRIIELHELFDSISDLIYQHTHDINSVVRHKDARKKFCMALIKLGLIK